MLPHHHEYTRNVKKFFRNSTGEIISHPYNFLIFDIFEWVKNLSRPIFSQLFKSAIDFMKIFIVVEIIPSFKYILDYFKYILPVFKYILPILKYILPFSIHSLFSNMYSQFSIYSLFCNANTVKIKLEAAASISNSDNLVQPQIDGGLYSREASN